MSILGRNETSALLRSHLREFVTAERLDFFVDEVGYVLGRFAPGGLSDYLNVVREGRGRAPRVGRRLRERLLEDVVPAYAAAKAERGRIDWNDLALLDAGAEPDRLYDVVIIDEAQDFSAHPLVEGLPVEGDGTLPDFTACNREGAKPVVVAGKYSAQLRVMLDRLERNADLGTESVALLQPRGGGWFDEARRVLRRRGIPFCELARENEWPSGPENVALCTIHSAKGLEFDHVLVPGLSRQVTPHGPEEGDNASRCPEIVEAARERGITGIVHFTRIGGLVGILASSAVKARNDLMRDTRLRYVAEENAPDRSRDFLWHDYVNMSVTAINRPTPRQRFCTRSSFLSIISIRSPCEMRRPTRLWLPRVPVSPTAPTSRLSRRHSDDHDNSDLTRAGGTVPGRRRCRPSCRCRRSR